MCLYTKLIDNPKYKASKKNGGNIPPVLDDRVKLVPIACGKCIECRKKKSRDWQLRLLEEIRENKNGIFVTLTFSNNSIKELIEHEKEFITNNGTKYKCKIKDLDPLDIDNAIATRGVRLFLERWRKEYNKSVRHWFVTELGHEGTENIHLHGIIWSDVGIEMLSQLWKYGFVWDGKDVNGKKINYVNESTIGYITKYITKADEKHPYYNPIILCSHKPGIGYNYVNREDSKSNKYKGVNTKEYYRTKTGHKMKLPIYWRNKIYSEDEREKLWIQKLDEQKMYVMGEMISVKNGYEEFDKVVNHYRKINKRMGYGSNDKDKDREEYERQRRRLLIEKRIDYA